MQPKLSRVRGAGLTVTVSLAFDSADFGDDSRADDESVARVDEADLSHVTVLEAAAPEAKPEAGGARPSLEDADGSDDEDARDSGDRAASKRFNECVPGRILRWLRAFPCLATACNCGAIA